MIRTAIITLVLVFVAASLPAAEPPAVTVTLLSVMELRRGDPSTVAKPIDPLFTNNAGSAMVLALRLQGPAIAKLALLGKAVIDSASDDRGTALKVTLEELRSGSSVFGGLIDRKSLDFFRHDDDKAPDVVHATLQLTAPVRGATRFSAHGTIQVVTGDREEIIVPGIVASGIAEADAARLKQAGLTLAAKLNAKGTELTITGTVATILDQDLIDGKGESLSIGAGSQLDQQGNPVDIKFNSFSSPLPKDARLKLVVLRNRTVVSVPIALDNVALP